LQRMSGAIHAGWVMTFGRHLWQTTPQVLGAGFALSGLTFAPAGAQTAPSPPAVYSPWQGIAPPQEASPDADDPDADGKDADAEDGKPKESSDASVHASDFHWGQP